MLFQVELFARAFSRSQWNYIAGVRRTYRPRDTGAAPGALLRKDLVWAAVGSVIVIAVAAVFMPTRPWMIVTLGLLNIIITFGMAFGSWVSARKRAEHA